jgi:hypothetical protein
MPNFAATCVFACLAASSAAALPASRTLLLVDDHDVLYRSGTHRVFHSFQRFAGNPVIKGGGTAWESAIAWMSVYRDPASGKYQLWYQATSGKRLKDKTRGSVVCYAESMDGIHFTKPDLGLFDYNGDLHNSIVLVGNGGAHGRYGAWVLMDDRDPNPARRYKMAYFDFSKDDEGIERPGLNVAFSPDGIHWEKYPHAPLVRTHYGGIGDPVPFADENGHPWEIPLTMADALDVMYDPRLAVFEIYGKMWIDGPDGGMAWKHAMGRTESKDFIHWSRPTLVLTPDDDDPAYVEFHTVPVFFHDDCYFGFLQILHRAENGGVIDVEMALSRNGLEWQRPFRKQPALPRGVHGAFDGGSLFPCATPVVLKDEIRFYYGAYSGGATKGVPGQKTISGLGFASIPRDRFAGIRPDSLSDQPTLRHPLKDIGQITLKPIELGPATILTLNADASRGTIRIELLDERGYGVRGFSAEDAAPIRGDSLRHAVKWNAKSSEDLPLGQYLVRIHLDDAEVFALSWEHREKNS